MLVAHDRGEPRQQATVEQEKTMLKPELCRLMGAEEREGSHGGRDQSQARKIA